MQVSANYLFTVFTPTYNRAHTLPRVFDSLQRQTYLNFEWLIVDDGSTDGTPRLVVRFQDEARFPVRYIRQPKNLGKHVAFNRGVREAAGELFLPLDSDDECVPEALARFKFHWDRIPVGRRDRFSAVTSLCQDEKGRIVGDRFPDDVLDSDSIELAYGFRVKGEKWGFHRTSVLRAHPFPEPADVRHVSEDLVWMAIARRYRTRFVNECLRVYHRDGPAGELSTPTAVYARGRRIFHAAILNDFRDVPYISPRVRARSAIGFGRYSFMCGHGLRAQLRDIRAVPTKALVVLCTPAALLVTIGDCLRSAARWSVFRSPSSQTGRSQDCSMTALL